MSNTEKLPKPPVAARKPFPIITHGHERIDDYFWMRLTDEQRDAENRDEQTKEVYDYLNAENEYTKKVMAETEDFQKSLYEEMIGRIQETDESVPYFLNGYWYYKRYEKGKEYIIHCRKKESLDADEEILLDVNELAKGHDYYKVGGLSISPDNTMLAFSEDTVSRRVYKIRFINLETGEFIDDELHNTTGELIWAADNRTVFYTTKNEVSLLSERVWRHQVGLEQSGDEIVYEEQDPSYYIGVTKSKSRKYIIIWNSSTLSNDYHLLESDNPSGEFRQFIPREDVHEYSIEHYRDKFYIATNWEAENFCLMETSEEDTAKENWKTVIPHREDVLITDLEIFKDHLAVSELKDGLTQINIFDQNTGKSHYLNFGETVYDAATAINLEMDSVMLRYTYSSLTTPASVIEYDMTNGKNVVLKTQKVIGGHNPEEYQAERLHVEARDGKKVPVSIVYKKGFEKDGTRPVLLYAYGSYGITIDPSFSSSRLSLLDRGFAFAIAHIRGSETLGRNWYDDGKLLNKLNTFNDFIDCAEYLINNQYTSAEHLYANGGSAGGLLMGAVANMSPGSFNGIIASVPFVDVINTMLDETIPLTTNEFDEWGNPKIKEYYDYMLQYSPYDQIKKQDYPNMLVLTGLYDSQVQYWEPAKWVAKLRAYKTDDNLLLFKTNMDTGHGGASGRYEAYKELAMEYALLFMMEKITR
ncbi:MAG: S9 family peptidase [Cyclobacteriaceae bacterium]